MTKIITFQQTLQLLYAVKMPHIFFRDLFFDTEEMNDYVERKKKETVSLVRKRSLVRWENTRVNMEKKNITTSENWLKHLLFLWYSWNHKKFMQKESNIYL